VARAYYLSFRFPRSFSSLHFSLSPFSSFCFFCAFGCFSGFGGFGGLACFSAFGFFAFFCLFLPRPGAVSTPVGGGGAGSGKLTGGGGGGATGAAGGLGADCATDVRERCLARLRAGLVGRASTAVTSWAAPDRRAGLLRRGLARTAIRLFPARDEPRGKRTRKWPSELKGESGSSNAIAGAELKTVAGSPTSTAPRHR
jgi:hypothetical protein